MSLTASTVVADVPACREKGLSADALAGELEVKVLFPRMVSLSAHAAPAG